MEKQLISQSELIGKTSNLLNQDRPEYTQIHKELVEQIIKAYEMTIISSLKEADKSDRQIVVKVFKWLKLVGEYVPEKMVLLYGKEKFAEAKISVKAKLSKYFSYSTINGKSMGN